MGYFYHDIYFNLFPFQNFTSRLLQFHL